MYFDTSILRSGRTILFQPLLPKLGSQVHFEESKSKIKNVTAFRRSSDGKIRKDPCLSHNENHGIKTFYASLHFKIK